MNRTVKYLLAFVITIVFSNVMKSAHIIGGDVTYQCINANAVSQSTIFQITFTMYRDPFGGGANFDTGAQFGLYKSNGNNTWEYIKFFNANPTDIQVVPFGLDCVIAPPNIGVEKATYTFAAEIPWSEATYQISYQRCCRNNSINNIENPSETGAAFTIELTPDAVLNCNNSPVFKSFPPVLICNGKPLIYDHSAIDIDGDQIVYEFCTPLTAGGIGGTMGGNPTACDGVRPFPGNCPPPYAQVQYLSGVYSGQNPMGGDPQVNINTTTGIITGTPNVNGQFVVGVCVKEYRNGVLISTIRRDFQFNVTECQEISENIIASFCEGESVAINDSIYTVEGNYTQVFQTSEGCDSTLHITIKEYQNQDSSINLEICKGGKTIVNGITYDSIGTYIQQLSSLEGCDSTLTLIITYIPEKFSNTSVTICDGDSLLINGISYFQSGIFTQKLTTQDGCDSTLYITVAIDPIKQTLLNYSLCDNNTIIVNAETYTQPGQYMQRLNTNKGCDSILIINIGECNASYGYNFDLCNAMTPSASMEYDEFVPTYNGIASCGAINATNIFRPQPATNKHSCTEGINGSIAVCVSSSLSCNADNTTATPITFEFYLNPSEGFDLAFSKLIFYQKAPENYSWIAGNNGVNNYPTKYKIRIFKNDIEIYNKSDNNTTLDWKEEKYNFLNNEEFIANNSTKYRVELTPYCAIGAASQVSAWDIDDVEIFTTCINNGNRNVSGRIEQSQSILSNAEVRAFNDQEFIKTKVNADGSYTLTNLKADKEYKISVYLNEDNKEGLNALDLVKIQRHILGIKKFDSYDQYHASDIDSDEKISVTDLVELRKVILGLKDEFSKNTSHKFLNLLEYESKSSPWQVSTYFTIKPSYENVKEINFKTVKVGDID